MSQGQSGCHLYLLGPGSQWVPRAYEAAYLLEASGAVGGWAMVWCHICLSLSSILRSHSTNFPYPGASPVLKSPA